LSQIELLIEGPVPLDEAGVPREWSFEGALLAFAERDVRARSKEGVGLDASWVACAVIQRPAFIRFLTMPIDGAKSLGPGILRGVPRSALAPGDLHGDCESYWGKALFSDTTLLNDTAPVPELLAPGLGRHLRDTANRGSGRGPLRRRFLQLDRRPSPYPVSARTDEEIRCHHPGPELLATGCWSGHATLPWAEVGRIRSADVTGGHRPIWVDLNGRLISAYSRIGPARHSSANREYAGRLSSSCATDRVCSWMSDAETVLSGRSCRRADGGSSGLIKLKCIYTRPPSD
jgi:hypothetical protein